MQGLLKIEKGVNILRPNIGLINALIRIALGITVVSWATAKLVKRPYQSTPLIVSFLGAMKIAEGITRFCPIMYLFGERDYYYYDDDDYDYRYDYDDEYDEQMTIDMD